MLQRFSNFSGKICSVHHGLALLYSVAICSTWYVGLNLTRWGGGVGFGGQKQKQKNKWTSEDLRIRKKKNAGINQTTVLCGVVSSDSVEFSVFYCFFVVFLLPVMSTFLHGYNWRSCVLTSTSHHSLCGLLMCSVWHDAWKYINHQLFFF